MHKVAKSRDVKPTAINVVLYTLPDCSMSLFAKPEIMSKSLLLLLVVFIIIEWFGREQQYAIERLGSKWPRPIRWAVYYSIMIAVFYFAGEKQQFIYFQF